MKKVSKFIVALIMIVVPSIISAGTISLSGATSTISPGGTFSVNLYVNPQGSNVYTARVELNFSSDVLEATGFSFGSGWLPITQSGYDLVNNSNGTLTKTAGFPGGISGSTYFGTVTFRAKTAGSANISVLSGTKLYDASNQNTFTGGNNVSVNVVSPAPAAPVRVPAPSPASSTTANPKRNLYKPQTNQASVTTSTTSSSTEAIVTAVENKNSNQNTALATGALQNIYFSRFAVPLLTVISSLLSFYLGYLVAKRRFSR